jgi:hypothetical protein
MLHSAGLLPIGAVRPWVLAATASDRVPRCAGQSAAAPPAGAAGRCSRRVGVVWWLLRGRGVAGVAGVAVAPSHPEHLVLGVGTL